MAANQRFVSLGESRVSNHGRGCRVVVGDGVGSGVEWYNSSNMSKGLGSVPGVDPQLVVGTYFVNSSRNNPN